jgi:hypothetical protein
MQVHYTLLDTLPAAAHVHWCHPVGWVLLDLTQAGPSPGSADAGLTALQGRQGACVEEAGRACYLWKQQPGDGSSVNIRNSRAHAWATYLLANPTRARQGHRVCVQRTLLVMTTSQLCAGGPAMCARELAFLSINPDYNPPDSEAAIASGTNAATSSVASRAGRTGPDIGQKVILLIALTRVTVASAVLGRAAERLAAASARWWIGLSECQATKLSPVIHVWSFILLHYVG